MDQGDGEAGEDPKMIAGRDAGSDSIGAELRFLAGEREAGIRLIILGEGVKPAEITKRTKA